MFGVCESIAIAADLGTQVIGKATNRTSGARPGARALKETIVASWSEAEPQRQLHVTRRSCMLMLPNWIAERAVRAIETWTVLEHVEKFSARSCRVDFSVTAKFLNSEIEVANAIGANCRAGCVRWC